MSRFLVQAALRLLLCGAALVAVVQVWAEEVSATFLSLEGDGTASVVIDGQVAYLADGGRAGSGGVIGASIAGKTVPEYLESREVSDVIVSCSHPHADHMDGLAQLIKSNALSKFRLFFVDNFRGRQGQPESLADIYRSTTGKEPQYVSSHNNDAFAGLPRGSTVRVRNFVYEPGLLGAHDHDASMIVEYVFGSGSNERVAVDFDDASERLLQRWTDAGRKLKTVIVPHHGSANNRITSMLAQRDINGLEDAIVTVNRRNRYGHPDPLVLLELVKALGADNVFLTDSDLGRNIVIDATGSVSAANRKEAKQRLNTYVEARLRVLEGSLHSSLDVLRGQVDPDEARRMRVNASTPREALELLVKASPITDREKARMVRLMARIDALNEVRALTGGSGKKANLHEAALAGLMSRAGHLKAADPGHPKPPGPEAGAAATTSPEPSPPFGGGGGGRDGARAYMELAKQAANDMQGRNPSIHPESGSWNRRAAHFKTAMRTTTVRFGGVIAGNRVYGPAPIGMEYVLVPDDEEAPVGKREASGTYVLRFTLGGGEVADYSGFSNQDLWAAVNFVQPMKDLREKLRGTEGALEVLNGSIGLVGLAGKMPFSGFFPAQGGWKFGVHPALSHSSLAVDAMRVDMLLSTSSMILGTDAAAVPPSLASASWGQISYTTYQWHDAPIDVTIVNGQINAQPADGQGPCAMRLRLIDEAAKPVYPAWFNPRKPDESFARELERAAFVRHELRTSEHAAKEEIARLVSLVDDAEVKAMESRPLDDRLQAMCREFDALAHLDRFVKLVAVLNWFQEHGTTLPELTFQRSMQSNRIVSSQLHYADVLPSRIPAVDWLSIAAVVGGYLAFMYLLVIGIAAIALVFAFLGLARKLRSRPNV